MTKLTYKSSNSPIGALIAVESTKKNGVSVSVSEGNSLSLCVDNNMSFSTTSSILRYLARAAPSANLYGKTNLEKAEVDHWLDFCVARLGCANEFSSALDYLNQVLTTCNVLVGDNITIADFAVWGALRGSAQCQGLLSSKAAPQNVTRYYKYLATQPAFAQVDSSVPQVKAAAPQQARPVPGEGKIAKEAGKWVELPDAEMGKVVVRFPPEASGYLHVGHAKAALLNQYYQQEFQGKLIMRFDDTNPAKEDAEFEEIILEDVATLGLKPDIFTFTSDSFELMLKTCEDCIKQDLAYCDDTDPETMTKERMNRIDSKNRNNSVAKNMEMWEAMKAGTEQGKKTCVRAKMNMQSNNGCMRDPAIYRCKPEPHPRTGTKYKVYPTYDFACPIVDSIEGVTHALRTSEYADRNEQYYWFIEKLKLRRPHVWEYSRLNLQSTVMSKRKLTWFVEQGLVDGWDDPRFPTVRGVMRRGMTVLGLKEFVIAQGSSKSINMMEWDKIWAFNKKVIDPVVPRYTALLKDSVVEVIVKGAKTEAKQIQKHPKDVAIGMKEVWFSDRVYIEAEDAKCIKEGEKVTFMNWGNMLVTKINMTNGEITGMEATPLDDTDFKKTQKLTWLAKTNQAALTPITCMHYDHIISKPVLSKDDDFKDYINTDSKHVTHLLGDPELRTLKKGERIQLQRRGYFICDSAYEPLSRYTGKETPMVLIHIPDGHTKVMAMHGSKHKEGSGAPAAAKESAKEKAQSKKGKAAEKSPPESVAGDAVQLDKDITNAGNKVRQLKSDKADKGAIDAAVKTLLALKADYKKATGKDWKPGATPPAAAAPASGGKSAEDLDKEVTDAGNKVRQLKSDKAAKADIDAAIKTLLALKADYKKVTGKDWKPGATPAATAPAAASGGKSAQDLDKEVTDAGNKVRQLKSDKAAKADIDAAVKVLLALKADYKKVAGKDWKPGATPAAAAAPAASAPGDKSAEELDKEVTAAGNKVRQLKTDKAAKSDIDAAVKILLALKADYKKVTGKDWKPGSPPAKPSGPSATPAPTTHAMTADSAEAVTLKGKVDAQGTKVRDLKTAGAAKDEVDAAVKLLLDLKLEYKNLTGEDLAGGGNKRDKKKGKGGDQKQEKKQEQKPKQDKKAKQEQKSADAEPHREVKKVTRLGLEAKKEENLPDWYSQVITKAEMIEYYDVSGCYVFRPWSFSIWEQISRWFDNKIKEYGFENCYFPLFVSNAALEREKDHIEDFAPEVAWVTKSGQSELAEPIAIRPTSETVMYPSYAKWVQSHRDLPIKLNQWCSVVRWEFKHPQPFLRTREFLWQEGHSAYATYEEAEKEVHFIIDLYEEIYETLLAIPVVKGKKTMKERFAGGDYTTTVEAYIAASGRGIQAATSHHLGQNFSKMFDISFEDPETHEKRFAYQNSWAITTRSIGVIVMVHGDNKGLVLPPRIACMQVVIVPCGITASLAEDTKKALIEKCDALCAALKATGIRVKADVRDNVSPGWKFNHWELKGVPLRVEIGPKDMASNQFVLVRRDNFEKSTHSLESGVSVIQEQIDLMHDRMFTKAKADYDDNTTIAYKFDDFCSALDKKHVILAPFCGDIPCEEKVKKLSARDAVVEEGAPAMGAKGLCIPFKQPCDIKPGTPCICPDCGNKPQFFTLFGRSY